MSDSTYDENLSLPEEFYLALEQLNAGEFFECHETLEALWIPESGRIREVYQGVLHIAVGCYHLKERRNWTGAVNQLKKAVSKLVPWPDEIHGFELGDLRCLAQRLCAHLENLGRDRIADYDSSFLPVARFHR